MRNISDSKISYYGQNKRGFLNNPRYKSSGRVKTKPTFNQLIKDTHNQLIEKWGPYLEVKKIDTSYDDLYAYQKKREAEREAQLEKEREKSKKKDWSIYGGWVNPFEPINKGRLGSTQEWRIEKPKRHYY
jgi:hypothetical protein